jgi:nitroimidazol reductase NimA-like FMN-containing flavoprotein (pyridoxamine 5'-phosphate oxidase superfamily)
MGKKKKEQELIDRVINNALYCHLACSFEDAPYLIPVAFGYDGDSVYIHTARSGKKIDILSHNPRVCLGFETDVSLLKDPDLACDWSFDFQSVIASGLIEEITDIEEKSAGLGVIMDHYSKKEWDFPPQQLAKTRLWRIRIIEISGKHSSN